LGDFTAKIPGPSFADQVTGTRKYFRELLSGLDT
jgi:hypothetical protein